MGQRSLVGARELKTRLGLYLSRVKRGDTIIVTDRAQPVAELRPIGESADPAVARLEQLAAAGAVTLPTTPRPARIRPEPLAGGAGSTAVSADRDERG